MEFGMSFLICKNDFVEISYSNDEDIAVKRAIIGLKKNLRQVLDCLIDQPVQLKCKKIYIKTDKDVFCNAGHKEQFQLKVNDGELEITGIDRRGTIYGIYWFCENILGVSPWTFWADVPINLKKRIELKEDFYYSDYPIVEYRGIFINDEEELEHFVQRYMGEETIGVKTYEKIFELLLRLGLNYIWPAMHVNSFNMKRENGELADSMGIVVGTSHCDMLMRSNNREWIPWINKKGYRDVEYDFSIMGRNREILEEYWRESVQQNKDFELTWTLGMRGIHDSGFEVRALEGLSGEELLKAKIKLLEDVMATQEKILKEELPGDKEIQKNFVPYKEVLELYDHGLKVPEDMTLIWVNDNYGNVRRYPSEEAKKRKGGHGLYYHNSYWAPPGASYLFLDSIPMAKTRNELKKAYREGIQKLWVTNFGAIKPLEQQLSFYARVAWEGAGEKKDSLCLDEKKWLCDWLTRTFPKLATYGNVEELSTALVAFDQLSDIRKVEFYDSDVIPVEVAKSRLKEFEKIVGLAQDFYKKLGEEAKPAFYELVLMRLEATYFTAAMYYYADMSAQALEDNSAADFAMESKKYDVLRRELLYYYNHMLLAGKWNGILTPEDFPPPRTALYPAASPISVNPNRKMKNDFLPKVFFEATSGKMTGDWHIIKNLGWAYGDLLETYGEEGSVCYEFDYEGEGILTLHRFPTLNSVERIRVKLLLDHEEEYVLETYSNDEYRGSWKENILNGVEILEMKLPYMPKGKHKLTIKAVDKYFAFSRLAIYEMDTFYNLTEAEKRWSMSTGFKSIIEKDEYEGICDPVEYSKFLTGSDKLVSLVPPRPILSYPKEDIYDTLALTDAIEIPEEQDFSLSPEEQKQIIGGILNSSQPAEKEGKLVFYAGACFGDNDWADYQGKELSCCLGQDLKGNSLGVLVRNRQATFESRTAPKINYTFTLEGGKYELWTKLYIWSNDEMNIEISVDEAKVKPYKWKYSSEHVWKWLHIMECDLEAGEHSLELTIFHGGVRVEAFKFIKI